MDRKSEGKLLYCAGNGKLSNLREVARDGHGHWLGIVRVRGLWTDIMVMVVMMIRGKKYL